MAEVSLVLRAVLPWWARPLLCGLKAAAFGLACLPIPGRDAGLARLAERATNLIGRHLRVTAARP